MKKRIFSVFLALVLVFGLMPAMTMHAEAASIASEIKLAGVTMKNGDYLLKGASATTSVKPTESSAQYAYYSNGVLTLYNFSYAGTGSYVTYGYNTSPVVLYCDGDLTIRLKGTNVLNQNKDYNYARTIVVKGNLTIEDSGDLDVYSTNRGIYAKRIKINDGEIVVKCDRYCFETYGTASSTDDVFAVNGGELEARITGTQTDENSCVIRAESISALAVTLSDTMKIKASTDENANRSAMGEYNQADYMNYDSLWISPALPEKVNAVASALKYDSALSGYAPDFKTFNVTLQNGYTTTELNAGSSALYETKSGSSYSDILEAPPKVGETYYGYVDIRSTSWAYDISEETCDIRIANFDVTVTSWSEREMSSYARIDYEATYKGGVYVGGVAMLSGDYLAVGATETTTTKPSGGYAYYKDGKLTLNNYSFTGAGYRYYYYSSYGYTNEDYAVIYSEHPLTIELLGNNILKQTKSSSDAIFVSGADLTVGGDGVLTATAEEYGICAVKNLVINGGTIDVSTTSDDALRSRDGSITINGGYVTAISGDQAINFGTKFVVADGMDCFASSTTDGQPGDFIYNNYRTYKKIVVHPHVHSWDDATCTTPKTCSVCSATEGTELGHSWDDATCTAPKTCSVCNLTEGTELGHSWVDATCTTPKTCSVCNLTEGTELGHSWADATCTTPKTCSVCSATEGAELGHSWVYATCTTPKTCSVCSATEGAELGHSWVDATCTAPKTCSVCGTTDGAALGHSWVDATCTAPKTCSVCGTTDGAALGHSWIDASCTAPKTCSVCSLTEGTELGHNWDAGAVTTPATETTEGVKTFTCTACADTKTQVIPVLSHTHNYSSVVTAPTCIAQGYSTYTCACGHSYVDNYTAATGHSAVADAAVAPTCTNTGLTFGTHCSVCGVTIKAQETVAALGHSWDAGIVTTPATESTEGVKTFSCTVCGETKTQTIPVLSHTHAYTSVVTAPTCIAQGYTTYTCACGHVYVDNYTAAAGHKAVADAAVAATCTNTGLSAGTHCSVCGVTIKAQETVAALGHSWDAGVVTTPATETTEGVKTFTCTVCVETKTQSIPVLGHTHNYTSVVTAPTCTEQGYTTYTCACGKSYIDNYVNAAGHTAVADAAVAATCTKTGLSAGSHCSVCGVTIKAQETVAALGHSWDAGTVTKAATESTEGVKTFTCTVCGETKTQSIPVLGHTHNYTSVATAPTCTTEGYTTYTCACGDSYVGNYVPALGHNAVVDAAVAATCTKTGLSAGNHCSVCGVTIKAQETVAALGHSWDTGIVTTPATEVSEGVKTFTCSSCGETKTQSIPVLGHTHNYTSVVTAPTCTEQGYTTHTCACGDSYKDSTVAATGHKWNEGTVTTPATETTEGIKTFTCTVCGETKTQTIPVLGHTHNYTSVVTAPTCTTEGYTTHTCSCGDSYKDSTVAATGHKWDEGTVTTPATETTEGIKTFTCTVCGETKTQSIPVLGHTHNYTSVVTAPTCTEQGYTTHTCACGDSYKDSTVAATGHKWDEGTVTTPATETTEGIKTFTCTACGETKTQTIPVLGHTHAYTSVVTAPTCTTEGYTTHTCSCGDSYKDSTVAALGHKWDGGKVTTEPTTSAEGVKTFTCTVCGETKTEKIDKLTEEPKPDPTPDPDPDPDPDPKPTNPFIDVTENQYYFEPVLWAVGKGVTTGTSATTFSPNATCTRAQVVTFLWRTAGAPEPSSNNNPFADVDEDQYYYKAVLWAVEKGITTGTSATTFSPGAFCTRAQVVTFLWRAVGKPAPTSSNNPFTDVPESQYYYDAVLWAVEKGVTTGMSATSFAPNATCTRGQIVTFLYRAYQ